MSITASRPVITVTVKAYLKMTADKDWIFTFMVQVDWRGTVDYPISYVSPGTLGAISLHNHSFKTLSPA